MNQIDHNATHIICNITSASLLVEFLPRMKYFFTADKQRHIPAGEASTLMIEEGTGPVSYTCYGQEEGSSLKSAESNSTTTELLRKLISTICIPIQIPVPFIYKN